MNDKHDQFDNLMLRFGAVSRRMDIESKSEKLDYYSIQNLIVDGRKVANEILNFIDVNETEVREAVRQQLMIFDMLEFMVNRQIKK